MKVTPVLAFVAAFEASAVTRTMAKVAATEGKIGGIGLIFHRRPSESEKAYSAFELYREFGPKRSLEMVAREIGKTRRQVERWSVQWHWVDRVREFDRFYESKRAELVHTKRMKALQRQAELGETMQNIAMAGLVTLDETELSAGELAKLAAEGVKIERLAMGDSTANIESRGIQLVFSAPMPNWAPPSAPEERSGVQREVSAADHLLPDVIDAG